MISKIISLIRKSSSISSSLLSKGLSPLVVLIVTLILLTFAAMGIDLNYVVTV